MSHSVLMAEFVMASGNWWEPGTPNSLDIGDLSAILGFLIALSAAFFGITKWWMKMLRAVIKEEIEIATEPIHPNSNGGLSLADVARKTSQLEKEVGCIKDTTNETKDLLLKVLSQSVILPTTEEQPKPAKSPRSRVKKTA